MVTAVVKKQPSHLPKVPASRNYPDTCLIHITKAVALKTTRLVAILIRTRTYHEAPELRCRAKYFRSHGQHE